ncbi:hypothetical protein A9Q99_10765 [Gammaproteobacteria bacterium 45_16_T64]|nr:hypothetical protein A9Q99_10765 [Gammaproteobacteria bacterium 45_16_T64]
MVIFNLYVICCVLLLTILAMNVSRVRMTEKIGNGDGGSKTLRAAIRSHGNALEFVIPFALLVLALDLGDTDKGLVAFLAFNFILVRIAHAWSMIGLLFKLRQVTAAVTYLLMVLGCGVLARQLIG